MIIDLFLNYGFNDNKHYSVDEKLFLHFYYDKLDIEVLNNILKRKRKTQYNKIEITRKYYFDDSCAKGSMNNIMNVEIDDIMGVNKF